MIADTPLHDPKPERDRSLHDVRLRLTTGGYGSVVELDGVQLKGVRGLRVEAGAGQPPTVYLEVIANRVDVDAEARVTQGAVQP